MSSLTTRLSRKGRGSRKGEHDAAPTVIDDAEPEAITNAVEFIGMTVTLDTSETESETVSESDDETVTHDEIGAPTDSAVHAAATDDAVEEIDPRIAARIDAVSDDNKRSRRRRWVRRVALVLALPMFAGIVDVTLHSPLFDVEMIDVLGASTLDSSAVAKAAGIHQGEAMISVDVDAATTRLRHQPWISRATVIRRWPGVVEIRVDERHPIVVLIGGDGKSLAIADGGVVLGDRFELGDTRDDGKVRTLKVDHLPTVRAGAMLAEPLRSLVELAGAVPDRIISLDDAATVSPDGDATFEVAKGRHIRLGDGSDGPAKVLAITTMLGGAVDMTGYCVLDVRIPSSPKVVRAPYCP